MFKPNWILPLSRYLGWSNPIPVAGVEGSTGKAAIDRVSDDINRKRMEGNKPSFGKDINAVKINAAKSPAGV